LDALGDHEAVYAVIRYRNGVLKAIAQACWNRTAFKRGAG